MRRIAFVPALLLLIPGGPAAAQSDKASIVAAIEAEREHYAELAHQIWMLAELGYQETRSSGLLQSELREHGFDVEAGVADIPTAFVASYGAGGPVIGVLAEFDALPGFSQAAVPERQPVEGMDSGHACGHHLFGTASTAAAIAVKDWLEATGRPGTIRVYGTPAEEGGSGKVYMVRSGLFEDVDVVLQWHPGDRNDANPARTLANKTGKFRFHGVSAHAAGAPDRGRSALDGVEALTHMINLMREHVPEKTRLHYVITQGGRAPNVVPDFAEVYVYVRHPEATEVERIWDWVVSAADGAAMGTATTVDHEITGAVHSLLPNEAIARVMHENLRAVGGVEYDAEEREFARRLYATLGAPDLELGSEAEVQPLEVELTSASTDAGDVSWVVPSSSISAATWVPGTAAHSWQAVAAGGTSIGTKGMLVAAKTLAMSALDLFTDEELVAVARQEFHDRRGADFVYRPLLGDRPPALDYRK